ncbi:hypothetical protein GcC1_074026 [Golovinomyces cichoracearum]|uniref:Uncharacterized protein n=1 Tax=Golovinomyces cichoracearum TaxID=62708 RepID=A0A420INJ6_9PEZI|nr:hypothetical protein GcC1_074026 [Golovinomyces cichoracearum]
MKTKTEDHHHILVLGATGTFGLILIQFIHNLGHTLTLYMCGQSNLPESIVSSECVEVIQGELSDVDGLEIAASCGADVFICVAVPTWGRPEGKPITKDLHKLYPLLLAAGTYKRLFFLTAPFFPAPEDGFCLKWFIIKNGLGRTLGGDTYKETRGMAQETINLGKKIKWTVIRVPNLCRERPSKKFFRDTNEKANVCFAGDFKFRNKLHLGRVSLAMWIMRELEEEQWIGLCPLVNDSSLKLSTVTKKISP